MLILTRKNRESILIELPTGEEIIITALGLRFGAQRIGIDAPKEFAISRIHDHPKINDPRQKELF